MKPGLFVIAMGTILSACTTPPPIPETVPVEAIPVPRYRVTLDWQPGERGGAAYRAPGYRHVIRSSSEPVPLEVLPMTSEEREP